MDSQPSREPSPTPPKDASQSKPPRRKLNDAAKELICHCVARGHTIAAAARMVGVSERAVYHCKQRDPLFKSQLSRQKEYVADFCLEALQKAVIKDENWRAALHYMQLIYPQRFHYKPGTITLKQHEAWTNEVLGLFEDIATPQQMQELHRRLSAESKPKTRSAPPEPRTLNHSA